MDALQNLRERRSIRRYKADMLPREMIETIAEAGTYAPTGKNQQSPIIIAVTNKDLRDKMSALNAKVLGSESDPFYGAPTVLVVLADPNVRTYVYDGALVMGNLMLAAHALGIGSCWIHRCKQMFEMEEGKALLKEWGQSENLVGVASMALGYADCEQPVPKPRKEDYIVRV